MAKLKSEIKQNVFIELFIFLVTALYTCGDSNKSKLELEVIVGTNTSIDLDT